MLQAGNRITSHFDFLLLLMIVPLIVMSSFLIYEANEILSYKQLIYTSIAIAVFILALFIPILKILWTIPILYWIHILMLILVYFAGDHRLGAQRWLEIPFVNFTIQPSETFKIFFVLMLGYLIKKNPPPINGYDIKSFAKLSLYILLPFFLILQQPDLGTALILLLMGFGVLFIVGVDKRIWISLTLVMAVSSPILYTSVLHNYQKQRVKDFISKEPSYHVKQSIIAIGSGGLQGNSKENATQTHFKFLPISTSDFIFAYYVERFGFLGAIILMSIYLILILYLLIFNIKFKQYYFIRVVASSIALLLFLYSSVNIAMTVGFAPVVGLPLPLFSYGGSSFITFCVLFAILQNLIIFRFDTLYDSVKIKNIFKGSL